MASGINVGGTWKDIDSASVNVGGTWKTVSNIHINVGGTWKEAWAAGGGAWTPASLFAASEQGAWYDPSDLTTMWTDDGVTQAGVNDLVYRIDDKSGNGNHAYQTTEASRPVLRQSGSLYYLEFDGVNDYMETGSYVITGPDQTAAVAYYLDGVAIQQRPFWRGATNSDEGAWGINTPQTNGSTNGRIYSYYNGTQVYNTAVVGTIPATTPIVGTLLLDSGSTSVFRANGTQLDSDAIGSLGTPASTTTAIGATAGTASLYLDGRVYQALHIDRLLTSQELSDTESHFATKSGATLA